LAEKRGDDKIEKKALRQVPGGAQKKIILGFDVFSKNHIGWAPVKKSKAARM